MVKKKDISERLSKLSPAKRALFEKRIRGKSDPELVAIPRSSSKAIPPLSFGQERIWFLHHYEPNYPIFNRPMALRLVGPLDQKALVDSLNEILRRHQELRSIYPEIDGRPVKRVNPFKPIRLPWEDLQDHPNIEIPLLVEKEFKEQASRPFDLGQGPLIRTTLYRLSENEHVLLLVMHHIIFDALSAQVLLKELTQSYQNGIDKTQTPLPELPIQYDDFALWQRQSMREGYEQQLTFWKKYLDGIIPILKLPTYHHRPDLQTHNGAMSNHEIPNSILESLENMCRQENCTLFMLLFTAFNILLYRYTGQEDITVGTPISDRNLVDSEPLIGFFINMVVLRTRIHGDPTFFELLCHVRESVFEAYDHRHFPFEKLIEEMQPERDLNRTPFFQIVFNFEDFPSESIQMDDLSITEFDLDIGIAHTDLTMEIRKTANGLTLLIEYNRDLFERETVQRIIGHYLTLLSSILDNPNQCISQLEMMTDAEKQNICADWNSITEYPVRTCIHQQFEKQVQKTPDHTALTFKDTHLSYIELNARANQLAHYLIKQGVGPDVLVGIYIERSLEMVVAVLGILKAGGAYVPIDPESPPARLVQIAGDANIKLLLTQNALVQHTNRTPCRPICMDRQWVTISQENKENPVTSVMPDQLAYVLFTSGTTGQPKGVLITHRNVSRLFSAMDSLFQFNDRDVWPLFHTLAFDFSVWEIWGSLLHGGRLVIVPLWICKAIDAFHDLLIQEKVTILNQTPTCFYQLMEIDGKMTSKNPFNLRLVFLGGEALDFQRLRPWFHLHGDQSPQLVNLYGITETTVHTTYRPLCKSDLHQSGSMIGRHIPDSQVFIVDKTMNLVPIGVYGEILVGGAGLGRGYWDRPDLTSERFVELSIEGSQKSRYYRTGDIGRYRSDGDIEFLGRMDHQVKIRGYRIELGEIEAALKQHPEIKESVTIPSGKAEEKRLIAYYTSHENRTIPEKELRNYLKRILPEYMIPAIFNSMESLPLNPQGKVSRRDLPDLDDAHQETEDKSVQSRGEIETVFETTEEPRPENQEQLKLPRNQIEEVITDIWIETLGLTKLDIHDNFFERGGHSLLATQVISRIRDVFRSKISVKALFENPTVAGLTATILAIEKQPEKIEKIAVLINKIKNLTDREAERRINE